MKQKIIKKNPESPFVSHALELLQGLGPVRARKMFGGYGLFLQDLMFALVADEMLYFKVDINTERSFQDLGLQQFTYDKKGKIFSMSYYQAPEACLEDQSEMQSWGQHAFGVALRAAAKKKKKPPAKQ
ncbi:MAG: TfoX/Sxy family protein [Nitrospirota bacterium]|nr:TfoX/Sxy family protein [Nitrospirota bacterium]